MATAADEEGAVDLGQHDSETASSEQGTADGTGSSEHEDDAEEEGNQEECKEEQPQQKPKQQKWGEEYSKQCVLAARWHLMALGSHLETMSLSLQEPGEMEEDCSEEAAGLAKAGSSGE